MNAPAGRSVPGRIREFICCAVFCAAGLVAFGGATNTLAVETCGEPVCCESEALAVRRVQRFSNDRSVPPSFRLSPSLLFARPAAVRSALQSPPAFEPHGSGHRLPNALPAPLRC